ncbi:Hypothetical predicted protein [Paramuricea clavata]|uniref:Uncharacterized protein n=1 Tax=Paramuricea clavata TaxID=317549 RepID=A0A7D9DD35_PARCT|nr:Hypothetical predicted protein [Paramuricea clavata]
MNRLSLKEKKFQTFTPASEEEINTLWQKFLEIEKGLQRDHLTMKDVKDFEHLKAFLKHCCIEGHYCFQVKKCDDILLPHGLQVHIKDHDCEDNIEKLYYACDYEPCCIYCGEYVDDVDEDDEIYPQCGNCTQDPVRKRK